MPSARSQSPCVTVPRCRTSRDWAIRASVAKSTCAVRSAAPGASNGSTFLCAAPPARWSRCAVRREACRIRNRRTAPRRPAPPAARPAQQDGRRGGAGFDDRADLPHRAGPPARQHPSAACPATKTNASFSSSPTIRSRQPSAFAPVGASAAHREIHCRPSATGRPAARWTDRRARSRRAAFRAGCPAARCEISTKCTRGSSPYCARCAGRPSPACRGPDPARHNGPGPAAPRAIQISASHSPISSPNIWLISGAVTKSPPLAPSRLRPAGRRGRNSAHCSRP